MRSVRSLLGAPASDVGQSWGKCHEASGAARRGGIEEADASMRPDCIRLKDELSHLVVSASVAQGEERFELRKQAC